MIPQRIRLLDFLSHHDTDVDLSDISMAVIVGANGFGKSSFAVDAITWCLFGEARGRVADDVIRHGEKECSVELTFLLEGKTYRVLRRRDTASGGKTFLGFDSWDGKKWISLAGNGVRETDLKIQQVLSMDYSTLVNSSMLVQGAADSFSKQDPAQRKAVLGRILGLDGYEANAVRVRERVREIKSQVESARMVVAGKEDELEGKAEIESATEEAKDCISSKQGQIGMLSDLLEDIRAKKGELSKDAVTFQHLTSSRNQLRGEFDNLLSDMSLKDAKIGRIEGQMGQADTVRANAAKYTEAKTKYDAMTKTQQEFASLTTKMQAAENNAGALKVRRERAVKDAQAEFDRLFASLTSAKANLQTQLDNAQSLAGELDTVPCKGTDLQPRCKLLRKAVVAQSDVGTLAGRVGDAATAINNIILSPEFKAIDTATAELAVENPYNVEYGQLEMQRELLMFDAEAYTRLNIEATKYMSFPALAASLDLLHVEREALCAAYMEQASRRDGLLEQIEDLDGQMEGYAGLQETTASVTRQLESTETALAEARSRLSGYERVLAGLAEKANRIAILENDLVGLRKDLEDKGASMSLMADLATMFGKNGVQAMLIEHAIPAIEQEANMLLGRLTDGLSISLETQRATGKGTIAETLDIVITDDVGAKRYEQFSGAERFRVDMALRVALSRLVASRAGAQIRAFIIDEGMACLDAESLGKMLDCLQIISTEFDLVLVVSHLEDVKNSSVFPTMINVTKDATGSHVEIIQN